MNENQVIKLLEISQQNRYIVSLTHPDSEGAMYGIFGTVKVKLGSEWIDQVVYMNNNGMSFARCVDDFEKFALAFEQEAPLLGLGCDTMPFEEWMDTIGKDMIQSRN